MLNNQERLRKLRRGKNLKVGDSIISCDGMRYKITSITPQYVRNKLFDYDLGLTRKGIQYKKVESWVNCCETPEFIAENRKMMKEVVKIQKESIKYIIDDYDRRHKKGNTRVAR